MLIKVHKLMVQYEQIVALIELLPDRQSEYKGAVVLRNNRDTTLYLEPRTYDELAAILPDVANMMQDEVNWGKKP